MNPLLLRQLRKHFPGLETADPTAAALLQAISLAYDELQQDCRLLEHTLEVTSEELNEANEKLRRDSESKLRSLSSYYLTTLESQQGMILRVENHEHGFIHSLCRGQLVRRMGWSPERVEGKVLSEFMSAERATELENLYRRVWLGEEYTHELISPDGKLVVLARLQPLVQNGTTREIIVSCLDITDLKRIQEELLFAKEKAETADRAKSEFLAVMSHEIRTPLNAVLGFTSLLQESPLTDSQREWVNTVSQSGHALMGLLNDILDFSKIEAGSLNLDIHNCELVPLLESVAAMFRPRTEERSVSLHLSLSPLLPETIMTDPIRLRQIVVNLLSNAVKFTHYGSVSLTATQEEDAQAGWHQLRISIIDTGIGIPVGLQDRLFKPFSQADSSMTRVHGGTGLGLAISQRLAKALGGEIDFESTAGAGSTFTLHLRVREGESKKPEPVQAQTTLHSRSSLRVLVAEDDLNNQKLTKLMLGALGIEPDLAEDGLQAVEAAASKDYDLVLMDVRMPRLDGLGAALEIRRRRAGRTQPRIVAVTASAYPDEQRRCMEAGMDGVLLKPFVFADFIEEIQKQSALLPGTNN